MAYNINTGETVLNGRTYTPHPSGIRLYGPGITRLANNDTPINGSERHFLIAAVRSIYRITDDRTAFTVGRSMIRALRAEQA
ncbi:hypothetical protein ACWC09_26565 [Streptomyces sp. NPDC001617]